MIVQKIARSTAMATPHFHTHATLGKMWSVANVHFHATLPHTPYRGVECGRMDRDKSGSLDVKVCKQHAENPTRQNAQKTASKIGEARR
jgi:hypothetical protein